jgi:hypothetical protein
MGTQGTGAWEGVSPGGPDRRGLPCRSSVCKYTMITNSLGRDLLCWSVGVWLGVWCSGFCSQNWRLGVFPLLSSRIGCHGWVALAARPWPCTHAATASRGRALGPLSHIMLYTAVLTSLSQRVKGCASAGKGRLEVVSVGCEAPTFSHRDSFEKSHFAKEAAPLGGSNRAPKPRARCLNSHFLYIKVSARHGWRVRKLKEGCPVLRWPCQCWPTAQALGNKV